MAFGLLLTLAPRAEEPEAEDQPSTEAPSSNRLESHREGGGSGAREVRPALARRKKNALSQYDAKSAPFDPKVFEARGRDLQGQYYEIAGAANPAAWNAAGNADAPASTAAGARKASSNAWMIWTGAAGVAAVVGGSVGYLMLEKHTAPEPMPVYLDDEPVGP